MRSCHRLLLSTLLLMPLPTLLSARGRAPAQPRPDATLVSAKRVFVRTFSAGSQRFYVVWNSSSAHGGSAVLAQRYAADNTSQWPKNNVLAHDMEDGALWDSCPDGQDGLFTAAVEKNILILKHVQANGSVQWEASGVSADGAGPVTTVVAVPDGHGGVFMTWAQGEEGHSTVWVQLWDASGHPQWAMPGIPAGLGDTHQVQPNILPDGHGGAVVAWKSDQEEVSRVRGQRFTVDGKRLWTDAGVGVLTPAGDLHQRITMVSPGSGSLVVAWTQGVDGSNRLFFQRIEPDGTRSWSGGGITGQPPILEQWNPVLLANGDGNVWIGWEQIPPNSQDTKVLLIRRGPPNGEAWTPGDIALAPTDGNQGKLALALDGAGSVLTAWIENRSDVALYLQQVDSQGHRRYPTGNKIVAGLKRPSYPHLALAAPGHVAVVWVEELGREQWELNHRVIDFR